MIDHDRLFKELLTTFFVEFVDLFLPEVSESLERDSITFLDKKLFSDVTASEKFEVDLLARARVRGEAAFFLIHLEHQSSPQAGFGKRMFRYFARLHEKYDLPIYPIVLFSYDAPKRAEPDRFEVALAGRRILDFHYQVIQLNRRVPSGRMARFRAAAEPDSERLDGEDANRAARSSASEVGIFADAGNITFGSGTFGVDRRLYGNLSEAE